MAELAARPITVLAMDAVPRISRAQSLDVLSSMANIAGYRAVIEAAHEFGRFFTGQVTAAGKVPPAKVLVAGAGVAGLAAIGAAGSLGAIVRATDPRPEVADQVSRWAASSCRSRSSRRLQRRRLRQGDVARTTTARAAEIYAEQAADVDIIITTALIPGRPAPRLHHRARSWRAMRPGSVIVDMAAAQGGNVERLGRRRGVVTDNGVTIIGYTDLAGRLPAQASQLYGTNLVNLLKLLTPGKDGQLVLDFDDVVQRSMTVVRDGEMTWPPPPVQVSAAPAAAPQAAASGRRPEKPRRPTRAGARAPRRGRHRAALFLLIAFAPRQLPRQLHGVRAGGRHRLLRHRQGAPRAAHAADVGDQRDLRDHRRRRDAADRPGRTRRHRRWPSSAILLASINIFGGFAVTRRMLAHVLEGRER